MIRDADRYAVLRQVRATDCRARPGASARPSTSPPGWSGRSSAAVPPCTSQGSCGSGRRTPSGPRCRPWCCGCTGGTWPGWRPGACIRPTRSARRGRPGGPDGTGAVAAHAPRRRRCAAPPARARARSSGERPRSGTVHSVSARTPEQGEQGVGGEHSGGGRRNTVHQGDRQPGADQVPGDDQRRVGGADAGAVPVAADREQRAVRAPLVPGADDPRVPGLRVDAVQLPDEPLGLDVRDGRGGQRVGVQFDDRAARSGPPAGRLALPAVQDADVRISVSRRGPGTRGGRCHRPVQPEPGDQERRRGPQPRHPLPPPGVAETGERPTTAFSPRCPAPARRRRGAGCRSRRPPRARRRAADVPTRPRWPCAAPRRAQQVGQRRNHRACGNGSRTTSNSRPSLEPRK
ncbi:hypothetical protein SFUMM280S_08833 [Streptomyces fumanus]